MVRRWLLKTSPALLPPESIDARCPLPHRGVRSPPSRLRLEQMRRGDDVLLQYLGSRPRIVAVTSVRRGPHPDPQAEEDGDRLVVLAPARTLERPVLLRELRAVPALADWELLRFPRLSVVAVPAAAWRKVLQLSRNGPRTAAARS